MIIKEMRALLLERKRRSSPSLPFTCISPSLITKKIKKEFFPNINTNIKCCFVNMKTLACIVSGGEQNQHNTIFIHDILNRIETPELVLRHIIIHELIHVLIEGREIDGKWTNHTPEFWELEKMLSPEGDLAWKWLYGNFAGIVVSDKKKEQTRVSRSWKKQRIKNFITLDQAADLYNKGLIF